MNTPDRSPPRVLLIDDNRAIHDDYRKILGARAVDTQLDQTKAALFGAAAATPLQPKFELTHAMQGEEGVECVRSAVAEGRPYAVAFIDVRMPPGWDGIETTAKIWEADPELQVVLCTAYSDYSWNDIIQRLGESESLLILKKPFDNIEVLQFAYALAAKSRLMRAAQRQIGELEDFVAQRTRQLQQADERFSKAFRRNPLPMLIHTVADGTILDANPALCHFVGCSPAQIINRPAAELGVWAQAVVKAGPLAAGTGQSDYSHPVVVVTPAGGERRIVLFAEQFDVDGVPCRLVLLQDVTERIRIESDTRQTDKMEAIGQLAAGVAHDFNNILTVIQGWLSLALSSDCLDAPTAQGLEQALKASERAGALTRQLLAYSRKQVMERSSVTVASLFEQVKAMLVRLIGAHIAIDIMMPAAPYCIHADRGNIELVLINLAVNARDAMPSGGTLTIDALSVAASPPGAPAPSASAPANVVCIQVKDTGMGMDASTKERIFDPFFTTKDIGKGTGMGLATVHGIVKQHQGWIEVDTTPHQGTTFRVFLPACAEAGSMVATRSLPAPPAKRMGHETILLVEDEAAVLEFAQKMLSARGYRVLAAGNAVRAMAIWAEERGSISLLFTDMVMPGGISGKKLAEQLKAEKPSLQVIFTSGYSLELIEGGVNEGGAFLQKPYTAAALEKSVRDSLEATPA